MFPQVICCAAAMALCRYPDKLVVRGTPTLRDRVCTQPAALPEHLQKLPGAAPPAARHIAYVPLLPLLLAKLLFHALW